MPSYRLRAAVDALHLGVRAEQVLPAAADAARSMTAVEACDVGVVGGRAQATVRFTASDDGAAREVAERVHGALRAQAQVDAGNLTRRVGNRWVPV